MKILGIETSCDETAASVVEVLKDRRYVTLLSSVTATSLSLHAKTGGIIPEVAARNQITDIIPVIYQALKQAKIVNNQWSMVNIPSIDAIAVTYGPGLIGSLLVGVETAKTLSYAWGIPLIPVNHLFGHIYANWIDAWSPVLQTERPKTVKLDSENRKLKTDNGVGTPSFPAIALIVSGGHTDLLFMKSHTDITWLGGTCDDAAGECFDKCARLIGYEYPGGPKIAELATTGNPKAFSFPRPMVGDHSYEFSFSGLKTAFLNKTKENFPILRTTDEKIGWNEIVLEKNTSGSQKNILCDLCASLQEAIIDVLVKKTLQAAEKFNAKSIILGGGVSANEKLKNTFQHALDSTRKMPDTKLFVPPKSLCTDNGAMIAAAAVFQAKNITWKNVTADPELYFD